MIVLTLNTQEEATALISMLDSLELPHPPYSDTGEWLANMVDHTLSFPVEIGVPPEHVKQLRVAFGHVMDQDKLWNPDDDETPFEAKIEEHPISD